MNWHGFDRNVSSIQVDSVLL